MPLAVHGTRVPLAVLVLLIHLVNFPTFWAQAELQALGRGTEGLDIAAALVDIAGVRGCSVASLDLCELASKDCAVLVCPPPALALGPPSLCNALSMCCKEPVADGIQAAGVTAAWQGTVSSDACRDMV